MIESTSDQGDSEAGVLSSGSSHDGRLRSAWLLLPVRLKHPPVALQALPLGVNAKLR